MIACVGETEAEREAGETETVLRRQVEAIRDGVGRARAPDLAYEPVWAIGTGKTATPEIAQEAHAFIRSILDVPILYGGSVKPENTAELMGQPDVDGALVGGASLEVDSFAAICESGSPLVALVVLDGWGLAPPGPGNAVELADTPVFDDLWERYPHTTLEASGQAVGLPHGQMGNSEVGHLTIGSGRVVYQDLVRINLAIEDGSFMENEALVAAFRRAKERGGNVHLLGLVSYGGVHSHIDHLRALLDLAWREGMDERTYVHAFTDGRDVSPTSARTTSRELVEERAQHRHGRRPVLRDGPRRRWERTRLAPWRRSRTRKASRSRGSARGDRGELRAPESPTSSSSRSCSRPRGSAPTTRRSTSTSARTGRASSARSSSSAGVDLTTMTRYREDFPFPVAFDQQNVWRRWREVLAEHGARQLHVAETEKYAHVTYFFNGGEEKEWEGETRILVPSPRDVPDLRPEAGDVRGRGGRPLLSPRSETATGSRS